MTKICLKKNKGGSCDTCFYKKIEFDCPKDKNGNLICIYENINFIQVPKPEEK